MEQDEQEFYEQMVSLLISMVCLIERQKLNRPHTTSELRKIGKERLSASATLQEETCQNTSQG
jgi:hypothetical protein